MELKDKHLYTSRELHLAVGRDVMRMSPFDVNYLHARKQIEAVTDEGTHYIKHYVAELQWRELQPGDIYGEFSPLMAFDNTVLQKLTAMARQCLGESQTPEAEALRRENDHLRAQNQKLIDTLLGVVDRRTK